MKQTHSTPPIHPLFGGPSEGGPSSGGPHDTGSFGGVPSSGGPHGWGPSGGGPQGGGPSGGGPQGGAPSGGGPLGGGPQMSVAVPQSEWKGDGVGGAVEKQQKMKRRQQKLLHKDALKTGAAEKMQLSCY